MRAKLRPFVLKETSPGQITRVNNHRMEVIWDQDMFFPLKHRKAILGEIQHITGVLANPELPPNVADSLMYNAQMQLNNALMAWTVKYGLSTNRDDFGNFVRVGILIKDPNFDLY